MSIITCIVLKVTVTIPSRLGNQCLVSAKGVCHLKENFMYKACPSESGTEVGAPLFPAVELCDFPGRWQCMSGEIWYILDSGSVLLTEAETR